MKQNNLKINNRSIKHIFKGEKHLRHTLMLRVESFEVILKNHMLHEITRVIGCKNIISKNKETRVLQKGTEAKLIKLLNRSLSHAMKIEEYRIQKPENSIFDWIHYLMLGNCSIFIQFFKT